MKSFVSVLVVVLAALAFSGCRGMTSKQPPVHPNLNMDYQEKYEAQEANPLFEDGRAMRPRIPGTVARGLLPTEESEIVFTTGRNASGAYVTQNPVAVSEASLKRGQERYHIYCAPCHGDAGDGNGLVWIYGQKVGMVVQPTTYHSDYLRGVEDGYLFTVISNGVRNMAGYKHQIPAEDRWKIVEYIRALQLSQNAEASMVPDEVRQQLDDNTTATRTEN